MLYLRDGKNLLVILQQGLQEIVVDLRHRWEVKLSTKRKVKHLQSGHSQVGMKVSVQISLAREFGDQIAAVDLSDGSLDSGVLTLHSAEEYFVDNI